MQVIMCVLVIDRLLSDYTNNKKTCINKMVENAMLENVNECF